MSKNALEQCDLLQNIVKRSAFATETDLADAKTRDAAVLEIGMGQTVLVDGLKKPRKKAHLLALKHARSFPESQAYKDSVVAVLHCLLVTARDYIVDTRPEYLEGGEIDKLRKEGNEIRAVGEATNSDNKLSERVFAMFKAMHTHLSSISHENLEAVTLAKFNGVDVDLMKVLELEGEERAKAINSLTTLISRHNPQRRKEAEERKELVLQQAS